MHTKDKFSVIILSNSEKKWARAAGAYLRSGVDELRSPSVYLPAESGPQVLPLGAEPSSFTVTERRERDVFKNNRNSVQPRHCCLIWWNCQDIYDLQSYKLQIWHTTVEHLNIWTCKTNFKKTKQVQLFIFFKLMTFYQIKLRKHLWNHIPSCISKTHTYIKLHYLLCLLFVLIKLSCEKKWKKKTHSIL